MKSYLIQRIGIVALLLSLVLPGSLRAQTLVMPSLADPTWYGSVPSPGSYILSLNTAMIDFNNGSGQGTLMVSTYCGNGTPGAIIFTDKASGFSVQELYNSSLSVDSDLYILFSPDIIVGNDATNPTTDYRVAMAYICQNTLTHTIQPQIDYWLVHYTSATTFTVTSICSTTFPGYASPSLNIIHIDGIAEAGNTTATGFPWCDKFIMTFEGKLSSGGGAGVFAYYGSLNSPLCDPGTATAIVSGGSQPDVAAIQRRVSHLPFPPTIDNIGLITYIDGSGNLQYIEWDVTAPSIAGGATLDNLGTYQFALPRIDAPDDYTINAIVTPPVQALYKVVVEATSGGSFTSNSYDNYTAYYSYAAFNTYPGVPNEYWPTVAFGGSGNTQYQVAHSSDDNSITGYPKWNTFMEPIDWNDYDHIAWNPGGTARDYFLVNKTPFNPLVNIQNAYNPTAISTPCNNPSDQTLVAWTLYSTAVGYSTVFYKTTGYGGVNGYSFRQAQPNEVSNNAVTDWNIYPNPAAGLLTIDNPIANGATYYITDMPGRTLLSGSLPAGTQTITVNTLSPGSYIISLYDGNKKDYSKVFIKQ